VHDIGVIATGDWSIEATITTLYGSAPKIYFHHSLDGATWEVEDLSAGIGWKGDARFVYPRFESSNAGDAWVIQRYPVINLSAITRNENGGPLLSSASLPTTITLSRRYSKVVTLTVTPVSGTTPRYPIIDNVIVGDSVVNSFDVYLFDRNGTQIASNFIWSFDGV
jgi:hypothetical protein